MNQEIDINLFNAVKELKSAILQSRYAAATLVNKELIKLYFYIGKYVSFHSRNKNWGKGAIDSISSLLQQELPGLRGFSSRNIKNMRIFYEEWHFLNDLILSQNYSNDINYKDLEIRQLPTAEIENEIRQLSTAELGSEETSIRKIGISDFSTKPTNHYNLDVII